MLKQRYFVIHVIGILCIAFSLALLPPLILSFWYHDGELRDFITTFCLLLLSGLLLWTLTRNTDLRPRHRDGFLIVAAFWLILSGIGAIPLMLGPHHLGVIDSLFEATSGITTTGATIIPDLNVIAPSILFYRQELQWLGGMGLVVLALAVLPILGMGGDQIYRAEIPGPMKDEKLTPRLAHTARYLWAIYVGLTIVCAMAYWLAGMTVLEAVEHSFSTVSTGGFSVYNESLGHFKNQAIDYIAVVFMLMGGINFSVHFLALRSGSVSAYVRNEEVISYLKIISLTVIIYTFLLYLTHTSSDIFQSLHLAVFEVISVITSTGLGITDFSSWPVFLPLLLILLGFIGGCGGSTAGGIKVMRIMMLFKQSFREFFLLLHPKAIRPIRIGRQIPNERTTQSVWGFFSLYMIVFILLTLMMILAGLDQVSAFSAVAACINNLGPGLGQVSVSFTDVSEGAKLLGVLAMLLGRLEIFTLLIILTPDYWLT